MKARYRHMMEQANLDKETKAAMLETILEHKQPRRVTRPLRTALVAACVCVLLVGTALAAQAIWGVRLEEKQQGNPGYNVSADLTLCLWSSSARSCAGTRTLSTISVSAS